MRIELDTSGLDELIENQPDRLEQGLRAFAEQITGDVKLSFGTSVSVPGDPPGVDTGTLRASMHWLQEERLRFIIADGVLYGLPLEIGTETIAARPFMNPAFERARKQFPDFIRRWVQK